MNSKQKGKRGELYVVNKFKENGYECNRTAQFKGNTGRADDIEGIDYIHAEVKFVEKLNLSEAMNQATRDCLASSRQAFPTIFHKKSREDLLVTMRFEDWIKLYNEYYSGMKLTDMKPIKNILKEQLEEKIKELNKEIDKVERKYYRELRATEKTKLNIELIKLNERQKAFADAIKMLEGDNNG